MGPIAWSSSLYCLYSTIIVTFTNPRSMEDQTLRPSFKSLRQLRRRQTHRLPALTVKRWAPLGFQQWWNLPNPVYTRKLPLLTAPHPTISFQDLQHPLLRYRQRIKLSPVSQQLQSWIWMCLGVVCSYTYIYFRKSESNKDAVDVQSLHGFTYWSCLLTMCSFR